MTPADLVLQQFHHSIVHSYVHRVILFPRAGMLHMCRIIPVNLVLQHSILHANVLQNAKERFLHILQPFQSMIAGIQKCERRKLKSQVPWGLRNPVREKNVASHALSEKEALRCKFVEESLIASGQHEGSIFVDEM